MTTLVFLLISIGDFYYKEWEWNTPTIEDRTVVLADVRLFAIEDVKLVTFIRDLAQQHKEYYDFEVRTWNKPHVYTQWDQEITNRIRCWNLLINALTPHGFTYKKYNNDGTWEHVWSRDEWGLRRRIQCLIELKGLIGEEDFYAGRMPSPIPNYKHFPNVLTN